MKTINHKLVEAEEYVDDVKRDLAALSELLDKAEGK